ncbi:MAG: LysR family transcriptional regulator [Bacilli bacterium]|nr:LysR family transcriptional regulator [Bacilli bacterium]
MINLELYRIFFVVAEEGNITKASEKLSISQPAVTKHIKNLEEQLGNPLFIRTKKGVVLNEFGNKLFVKVKQAINLINEAEKELNNSLDTDSGTIRIGISTSLTRKILLKHMELFHKEYPNVVFDIYTDPSKELVKKLKNGMIDIIVGKIPNNKDMELDYINLGETEYIFVGNENYRELSLKELSLEEISKYPLLLQKEPSNSRWNIDKLFEKNNIHIEPKMNIASSSLLVDFVLIGYGIGYVTKLYIEEELKNMKLFEIKVKGNDSKIEYGVAKLKNNVMSSHCNKFVSLLKKEII